MIYENVILCFTLTWATVTNDSGASAKLKVCIFSCSKCACQSRIPWDPSDN